MVTTETNYPQCINTRCKPWRHINVERPFALDRNGVRFEARLLRSISRHHMTDVVMVRMLTCIPECISHTPLFLLTVPHALCVCRSTDAASECSYIAQPWAGWKHCLLKNGALEVECLLHIWKGWFRKGAWISFMDMLYWQFFNTRVLTEDS